MNTMQISLIKIRQHTDAIKNHRGNLNFSLTVAEKKAASKSAHVECVAPAYRLNFSFNLSDCVWFKSSNVPTVKKEETLVLIAATKTSVWKMRLKNVKFCKVAKNQLVVVDIATLPLSVEKSLTEYSTNKIKAGSDTQGLFDAAPFFQWGRANIKEELWGLQMWDITLKASSKTASLNNLFNGIKMANWLLEGSNFPPKVSFVQRGTIIISRSKKSSENSSKYVE